MEIVEGNVNKLEEKSVATIKYEEQKGEKHLKIKQNDVITQDNINSPSILILEIKTGEWRYSESKYLKHNWNSFKFGAKH